MYTQLLFSHWNSDPITFLHDGHLAAIQYNKCCHFSAICWICTNTALYTVLHNISLLWKRHPNDYQINSKIKRLNVLLNTVIIIQRVKANVELIQSRLKSWEIKKHHIFNKVRGVDNYWLEQLHSNQFLRLKWLSVINNRLKGTQGK